MIVAVVQARMGSSRLPGKVLRDLGGRPVLSWVLRAARESGVFDDVVVATSTAHDDDAIAAFAKQERVRCVRGPLEDVLTRFLVALDETRADAVARLTGDCPLLDPVVLRSAVAAFGAADIEYLGTVTPRSLPRGLDVEVASAGALRRVDGLATGADRAHVTSYLYRHPEQFLVAGIVFAPPAADLRVTLDTEEDAQLLDEVVRDLGDRAPSWREVVTLLRARPDLVALNAGVEQKALDEG